MIKESAGNLVQIGTPPYTQVGSLPFLELLYPWLFTFIAYLCGIIEATVHALINLAFIITMRRECWKL